MDQGPREKVLRLRFAPLRTTREGVKLDAFPPCGGGPGIFRPGLPMTFPFGIGWRQIVTNGNPQRGRPYEGWEISFISYPLSLIFYLFRQNPSTGFAGQHKARPPCGRHAPPISGEAKR